MKKLLRNRGLVEREFLLESGGMRVQMFHQFSVRKVFFHYHSNFFVW